MKSGHTSKGISPLVAAVMLVAMSVVLSVVVSNWVTTYGTDASSKIKGTTKIQLQCQFSNIIIKSAVYDCGGSCITGNPYRMNTTIENTGKTGIDVSRAVTKISSGQTYQFEIENDTIGVGSTKTINFNTIVVTSNPVMPAETIDTRKQYSSYGNTFIMCHYETTNCTSEHIGIPLTDTGTSYSTGKFSNGVVINSTSILVYNGTGNFNASKGTAEFFIIPNVDSSSCSGCTFFYANTSSGDAIRVFTSGGAFALRREQNGVSLITSSIVYSAGNMYHVAATWGSGLKLYVNGVLEGTNADNGNMSGTPDKIRIGSAPTGSSAEAVIDELRISRVPRGVSTNITYNVTMPNIERVKLYNLSDVLIDDSGSLGGVSSYMETVNDLGINEYRIEVTKTNSQKYNEFYPFSKDQSCVASTGLSGIIISDLNCPKTLDSIPGTEVTYVNCT